MTQQSHSYFSGIVDIDLKLELQLKYKTEAVALGTEQKTILLLSRLISFTAQCSQSCFYAPPFILPYVNTEHSILQLGNISEIIEYETGL